MAHLELRKHFSYDDVYTATQDVVVHTYSIVQLWNENPYPNDSLIVPRDLAGDEA